MRLLNCEQTWLERMQQKNIHRKQLGFQSLALLAAVHGMKYFVRKQKPHVRKLWLFRVVHLKMEL